MVSAGFRTGYEEGKKPLVVQLAQDRSEDEDFLWEFRLLLAGVFVVGSGTAAVIGYVVERRGLKPVGAGAQSAGFGLRAGLLYH